MSRSCPRAASSVWSSMPTRRSARAATRPSSGASRSPTIRSRVLLPAPLRPTTPMRSVSSIPRLMPSSRVVVPCVLRTASSVRSTLLLRLSSAPVASPLSSRSSGVRAGCSTPSGRHRRRTARRRTLRDPRWSAEPCSHRMLATFTEIVAARTARVGRVRRAACTPPARSLDLGDGEYRGRHPSSGTFPSRCARSAGPRLLPHLPRQAR